MKIVDFSKLPCFVDGCHKPRLSENAVFCASHCDELVAACVQRLKLLAVMQKRDLSAFLKEHRDLRICQGDLVQLAEMQVMGALVNTWEVFMTPDNRKIQYITVRAAELAPATPIENLKVFLAANGISPQASSLIQEDARSQKNGWQCFSGGKVRISTKTKTFAHHDELYAYLKAQSNLTHPVEKIISMYNAAADHVCKLIDAGRVVFVQNGTLLYLKPAQRFDPTAAVYWRKHVLDGLLNRIQNPGHGAVPSQAEH